MHDTNEIIDAADAYRRSLARGDMPKKTVVRIFIFKVLRELAQKYDELADE
jgi:hypothetical protein